MKVRPKGSLLLEAVFSLPVLVLAVMINFELIRRAQHEVLMQQGAFILARARALGSSSDGARREVRMFFESAYGREGARAFWKGLTIQESWKPSGVTVKFHRRYRSFLIFPLKNGFKHHFEITRECHFPLS